MYPGMEMSHVLHVSFPVRSTDRLTLCQKSLLLDTATPQFTCADAMDHHPLLICCRARRCLRHIIIIIPELFPVVVVWVSKKHVPLLVVVSRRASFMSSLPYDDMERSLG